MERTWTVIHGIITLGILFGAYLVFHGYMVSAPTQDAQTPYVSSELQYVDVMLGDTVVRAEIADTPERRQTGLSGRRYLEEGDGMLFVFDRPDHYAFWMPDMYISLDIIWFDSSFTVITIAEDVTPESYPEAFMPDAPAQYVLEVPAGFSRKHGIAPGLVAVLSTL